MKKDNHAIAKRLLHITAIIFAAAWIILILSAVLMSLVSRSSSIFIFSSIIGIVFFTMPIPCLILAISGTVFAYKSDEKKYKYIGYAEISISVFWMIFSILLFYFGQGV